MSSSRTELLLWLQSIIFPALSAKPGIFCVWLKISREKCFQPYWPESPLRVCTSLFIFSRNQKALLIFKWESLSSVQFWGLPYLFHRKWVLKQNITFFKCSWRGSWHKVPIRLTSYSHLSYFLKKTCLVQYIFVTYSCCQKVVLFEGLRMHIYSNFLKVKKIAQLTIESGFTGYLSLSLLKLQTFF